MLHKNFEQIHLNLMLKTTNCQLKPTDTNWSVLGATKLPIKYYSASTDDKLAHALSGKVDSFFVCSFVSKAS
jgi:hypothetical protein